MYKPPVESTLYLLMRVLRHDFEINGRVFKQLETLSEDYTDLNNTSIAVIKEAVFANRIQNGEQLPDNLTDLEYCLWCLAKLEVEFQHTHNMDIGCKILPLRSSVFKIANLIDHIELSDRMAEQGDNICFEGGEVNNSNPHRTLMAYMLPTLRAHLSILSGMPDKSFEPVEVPELLHHICDALIGRLLNDYSITTKRIFQELKETPTTNKEYFELLTLALTAFNWCKILENAPPQDIIDQSKYFFDKFAGKYQ